MPTVIEIAAGKTGAVKYNAEIVDLVKQYMQVHPGEHGDNTTQLFAHLLKQAISTPLPVPTPEAENEGLQAKITDLQKQITAEKTKTWDAVKRTMELYHNPLFMLTEEEFQTVIKWDKEVFEPAMEQLTQEPKVLFNARQKFLLMLNYSTTDPVGQILTMLKAEGIKLSQVTEDAITDLQFPRLNDLQAVFAEWKQTRDKITAMQNDAQFLGKNIAKYLQGYELLVYAKMNNADVTELLKAAEAETQTTTTGTTSNTDNTGTNTEQNGATE